MFGYFLRKIIMSYNFMYPIKYPMVHYWQEIPYYINQTLFDILMIDQLRQSKYHLNIMHTLIHLS